MSGFQDLAWRLGSFRGDAAEINTICPAITPSGTEKLINGSMELDSDWANQGTPTTNERSNEQAHSGTYSRKFITDAGFEGIRQFVNVTAGVWHQLVVWGYLAAGNSIQLIDVNGVVSGNKATTTSGSWVQLRYIERSTGTSCIFAIRDGSGVTMTGYADDGSLLALTFSSLITLLGTRSQKNGTYICTPTVTDDSQCGILLCYLDANNFVQLIINRNGTDQAQLVKKVSGTFVSVVAGNITYSAAAQLKVILNGTNASLYYNGVQIGATTAIAEIASLGRAVYGFNTLAGNTVGTVQTTGATS